VQSTFVQKILAKNVDEIDSRLQIHTFEAGERREAINNALFTKFSLNWRALSLAFHHIPY